MMIKIIPQSEWGNIPMQCTNCHSDNDIKLISIENNNMDKSIMPLCRDCRKYLLELLICDAESKADTGNSNSNNEERK